MTGNNSPTKIKEDEKYNIRAIERALSVLEAFSIERRKLSLDELTKLIGLSKPTVFRILSTLQSRKFIYLDKGDGRYRLGSVFLTLASAVHGSSGLGAIARPHLTTLRNSTQATVLLGALLEDHLVYLDKTEGRGPVRLANDIAWRRDPAHYGMLGMTLMAYLEPSEVERLLDEFPLAPHTLKTLTDRNLFLQRIGDIRRIGYALEFEEAIDGVWGVAAPIRNAGGEVVAAVGVALPMSTCSEEHIAETIASVTACAAAISSDLGHRR
ncbi:IclR family transcriptional regulator [Geotalea toluenoxydans]|uniref:IclR family transcriptional regulator n=1 Tax=Geotalea toluenoxydans TaxID=421624 RepID=UPI0006CFB487|nr:IclR family transcriptional regulator [Geotalea toluenoxydans]